MSNPDYAAAYGYISGRLLNELSPDLYYHSFQHTIVDVLPAAERLAQMEGISDSERLLLQTAALYHDIGYVEAHERNEPIAARIANETLPGFGYSTDQIRTIHDLIMVTQLPQQPQTHLQQIMCDADLDALGRDDFFITSHRLRLELSRYGQPTPLRDWYTRQLAFLEAHQYFTASARALHDAQKHQIAAELRQLLGI
jgi:uncharacterized protein